MQSPQFLKETRMKDEYATALQTLLAFKVISLMPGLSVAARRVACAIIDHFNRFDGQCDPSVTRLALLLGLHRRTVLRAIDELDSRALILKERHGGLSQRNSYEPIWDLLGKLEEEWKQCMRSERRFSAG
jgi:hypothetical protein